MHKLVLIRHGQSIWNKENRFTGWVDVGLSEKGREEAHKAGKLLQKADFEFTKSFTSVLQRAIKTLWIILEEMGFMWLPVIKSWKLNERHYGALQGLNKAETINRLGKEKVHLWRRSFSHRPPLIEKRNEQNYGLERISPFPKLDPSCIPSGESLEDTSKRTIPFWEKEIAPSIQAKEKILIVAHGNSLRSLIKHIEHLPEEEISKMNIPTGTPIVYELDKNLEVLKKYHLLTTI